MATSMEIGSHKVQVISNTQIKIGCQEFTKSQGEEILDLMDSPSNPRIFTCVSSVTNRQGMVVQWLEGVEFRVIYSPPKCSTPSGDKILIDSSFLDGCWREITGGKNCLIKTNPNTWPPNCHIRRYGGEFYRIYKDKVTNREITVSKKRVKKLLRLMEEFRGDRIYLNTTSTDWKGTIIKWLGSDNFEVLWTNPPNLTVGSEISLGFSFSQKEWAEITDGVIVEGAAAPGEEEAKE